MPLVRRGNNRRKTALFKQHGILFKVSPQLASTGLNGGLSGIWGLLGGTGGDCDDFGFLTLAVPIAVGILPRPCDKVAIERVFHHFNITGRENAGGVAGSDVDAVDNVHP